LLGGVRSRRTFWALMCGATLVLFRNFTADVLHPDNLQMLHATLTLLLSFEAAVSRRFGVALAAVVVAGIGVWTKQVEVLAVIGATVAVLSAGWSRGRALMIVATGATATAIAVAVLLTMPFARYYLLDLLLAQTRVYGIDFARLLVTAQPFFFGHRLLLACLAIDAVRRLWHSGGELGRRFLFAWAAVGATTAAPCLSAYLKPMGVWNNLVPLDVWAFLLVAPTLVTRATAAVGLESRLRWALVLALLVTLFPAKVPPSAAMYAYGEALDSAIQADVAAGKHVLLAHGTMPLIRAGVTAVPLDRGNSNLEMLAGGRDPDLRAMVDRFHTHVYDRIYVNTGWYGMMMSAIEAAYRESDTIPPAALLSGVPLSFVLLAGHDRILKPIHIYVPKD